MRESTSPLLLAAVVTNGLLLAVLLARAGRQNPPLRWLAALVAVLAVRIVPYPLGFTGAYDTWRWLTFLPVDASFALGPLLWGYVIALSRGTSCKRLRWHFAPAAVQLVYQLVAFAIPQPLKGQYYARVHVAIIEPIGLLLVLASLGFYTVRSWRDFTGWQRWMDDHLSNREAYRLGGVRFVLMALTAITIIALAGAVRHLTVSPLNYGQRAPIILGLGVMVYGLGLAGLVQRDRRYPVMSDDSQAAEPFAMVPSERLAQVPTPAEGEPLTIVSDVTETDRPRRGRPQADYAEQGRLWAEQVRAAGWHRDPELTLATLAQALNASPRTVSRVLREGLGITFHAFVNGLRVEEVAARLADPAEKRSALVLALEAGFASKASFTRAFREAKGVPASVFRNSESD